VRRALYLVVLGRRRAVSRDEAASEIGIRRGLAAFHLDRLADDGLLQVEYRRLSGRVGPGAGRPAKLYRIAEGEHEVSLPPRAYAFAAALLAEALAAARPGGSGATAEEIARDRGRQVGALARAELGSRPPAATRRTELVATLARIGYQPEDEGGGPIRLRNCPFHALADLHRELVCGMNEAFVAGVLDGLDLPRFDTRLQPTEGECCVSITHTA
jgi:predicted ArsR family transcriptional regulator